MVEIRVEEGPATVEVMRRSVLHTNLPGIERERGPVRLVVIMHGLASTWRTIAAIALTDVVFLVVFVALVGISHPALLLGGLSLLALASYTTLRRSIGPEILEVDSRLVTLKRHGSYVGIWGREQLIDPRLNEAGSFSPALVWGDFGLDGKYDFYGAAGVGLPLRELREALDAIRAFCDEHPIDSSHSFKGGWVP